LEYEIKYSFPFKSETKRMGILLKNVRTNEYMFYLKGADAVMKDFIPSRQKRAFIEEECKDLSMTGLRTLVITYKKMTEEFYAKWSAEYEKAYNRLEVDQKTITRLINELEYGVEFLGITGIEDKLQNSLKPTIENLRSGGIKIWMITGDKMETAECISRSCGLQKSTEANYKIEEANDFEAFEDHWRNVKSNLNQILIIDGKTLSYVLDNNEVKADFFRTAMKLPTVICCRCSPNQKRLLTAGVKKHKLPKEAVLGIGDGGNDVGMIQEADVGIGILGKEGMQAALAADFSIREFRDVKTLLFWHGRLSYIRSSLLINFIIHRGFIISVIQIIFSCIFYYVSIPVFNSYLQLGYATIFTFWPVFALILDKDINVKSF
jgi:phospholipid-translocating ATPase